MSQLDQLELIRMDKLVRLNEPVRDGQICRSVRWYETIRQIKSNKLEVLMGRWTGQLGQAG